MVAPGCGGGVMDTELEVDSEFPLEFGDIQQLAIMDSVNSEIKFLLLQINSSNS